MIYNSLLLEIVLVSSIICSIAFSVFSSVRPLYDSASQISEISENSMEMLDNIDFNEWEEWIQLQSETVDK